MALEKLLTTKSVPNLSLEELLPPITEIVSQAFCVERVSVWRFDSEGKRFACLDLVQNGTHSSEVEFSINNVPQYFESMVKEGLLAAFDASQDFRTAKFKTSYLEPLGIASMLDTLIYWRGNLFGILCIESCHQKRVWEEDERTFALAVSNVISLCIEQCEHERTTRKVKEAHDRLQTVLDATRDSVWDWDLRTNTHWLSSNFGTIFGHSGEVFEKGLEGWITNIHAEDRKTVVESFQQKIAAGETKWSAEYRFKRGDGSFATVLDRAVLTLDDTGKVIRATGAVTDISELRRSEARFRLATLATHELIWEWNIESDEMWWSDSLLARDWFSDNEPEKSFSSCSTRIHPEDRQRVLSTINEAIEKKERFWTAEHRILLTKDGIATVLNKAYIEYADDERPMRMIGAIQDITERKTLKAKFLRAQRFESIGTLASGVAHDLNNVLAPILMGTELLGSTGNELESTSILENMRKSAERGGEIVHQLLTFTRGAEGGETTNPGDEYISGYGEDRTTNLS
ncbi:MAG: PAS domain-containing protein [Verrucomicrobiales bacterium]